MPKGENMKRSFINLQLFGEPSGDPTQSVTGPTGPDAQTPGQTAGDASSVDAEMLMEYKRKHVTREEYEREKARADSYLRAILENRESEIAGMEGTVQPVDPNDIAKKMFVPDNGMSDLEYVTNALALRDARIAAGERDPFLPDNYDDQDVQIAQNVAEVLA